VKKHFYNDPDLGKIEIKIPNDVFDLTSPQVRFMWNLKTNGEHEAYTYVFNRAMDTHQKDYESLIRFYKEFLDQEKAKDEKFKEDFDK
jgi:hypothetical protein